MSYLVIFSILFCLFLVAPTSFAGIFSHDESTVEEHHPSNEKEMDMTVHPPSGDVSALTESTKLYSEVPGMAAFFGSMLDSLLAVSVKSENQFKNLAATLPLVFPDLHKVFITL